MAKVLKRQTGYQPCLDLFICFQSNGCPLRNTFKIILFESYAVNRIFRRIERRRHVPIYPCVVETRYIYLAKQVPKIIKNFRLVAALNAKPREVDLPVEFPIEAAKFVTDGSFAFLRRFSAVYASVHNTRRIAFVTFLFQRLLHLTRNIRCLPPQTEHIALVKLIEWRPFHIGLSKHPPYQLRHTLLAAGVVEGDQDIGERAIPSLLQGCLGDDPFHTASFG